MLVPILLGTLAQAGEDPHQWLEEVHGAEALDWVRARNDVSVEALTQAPGFEELRQRLLAIHDSDERIAHLSKLGKWYYNFWRDAEHPRGIWRRTSLESYRSASPDWEIVLDLDALAREEGENWVWHGARCLPPDRTRCLVSLSRGGADASVLREFDIDQRDFVEGGFELPEAKTRVSWIDIDRIFVATDFGDGSLTSSGYPRIVKEWRRGTPLEEARTVYEADFSDVSAHAWYDHAEGYQRAFVGRAPTFFTSELYLLGKKGPQKVEKPDDAEVSVHRDWLFLLLRSDWTLGDQTYAAGSLLVADFNRWMKGRRQLEVLFAPTPNSSLASFTPTRNKVVLDVLEDVRTRIEVLTPGKRGWARESWSEIPELGQANVWAVDADESDDVWMSLTGYLTPSSLWLGRAGEGEPELLAQLPSFFDAAGLEVTQHFATSADGTRVPYFQVARRDLPLDGNAVTLLYGYGGFEVPLLPQYHATAGAAWLERGGVYVVANIRGGGEYGPRWHQAALKENRHRAYEDFAAVAEDLVARGVTRPERLGAQGGSNGGLLMGNMYTDYPDRFGAIVCQVPLLDMKRYTHLLAGASWMGEYGDPDDSEQWEFIRTFSPYHKIRADVDHPPMLLTTSTRDDRVHPGHARKMAAELLRNDKSVLYYENIEGGHGGAANNEQAAFMQALAYTFLWSRLSGE